jgi:hypothetical protein
MSFLLLRLFLHTYRWISNKFVVPQQLIQKYSRIKKAGINWNFFGSTIGFCQKKTFYGTKITRISFTPNFLPIKNVFLGFLELRLSIVVLLTLMATIALHPTNYTSKIL